MSLSAINICADLHRRQTRVDTGTHIWHTAVRSIRRLPDLLVEERNKSQTQTHE